MFEVTFINKEGVPCIFIGLSDYMANEIGCLAFTQYGADSEVKIWERHPDGSLTLTEM